MKRKIVGIVVLMLVATMVASATKMTITQTSQTKTSQEMTSLSKTLNGYQPTPLNWGVDQKQTHTDGSGLTLYPPDISAQSFTPTKDKLTAVSLWLFKYASPPEPNLISVAIRDNLTGPDLATQTINTSVVSISSMGTWVLFDFDDISVTQETTYYIICTGTAGDPGNAYCWLFSANDTYSRGDAWYKANVNYPWNINHAIGDFCFKTYFRKPLDISIPQNNGNIGSGVYSIDVPVWTKGDSWTFDTRIIDRRYNAYVTHNLTFKLFLNYTETVTVTDDTGDNYTVKVTGKNIEGSLVNGSYRFKFTGLMKETGEIIFRKTDLAVYHETYTIKGLVFWLFGKIGFPLPAQLTFFQDYRTPAGYVFLPFPLNPGTNGTTHQVRQTYQEKWSLYWGFKTLLQINQTYTTAKRPYQCEMANITIPAGTYNAYNISIDQQYGLGHYHLWRYYVENVGFQAKIHFNADWDTAGRPGYSLEYNLLSTTYTP